MRVINGDFDINHGFRCQNICHVGKTTNSQSQRKNQGFSYRIHANLVYFFALPVPAEREEGIPDKCPVSDLYNRVSNLLF